ncbi:hypothetical protein DITRI_Ditri06bG0019900 [Diplodiscus trichospermus]
MNSGQNSYMPSRLYVSIFPSFNTWGFDGEEPLLWQNILQKVPPPSSPIRDKLTYDGISIFGEHSHNLVNQRCEFEAQHSVENLVFLPPPIDRIYLIIIAQVSISKAMIAIFVSIVLSIAATVSAQGQDEDGAMAPAPSMDTGAAFSSPVSWVVVAFALIISLVAFLKH